MVVVLQVSSWVKENLLLVMTILGVVLGVLAGAFARTLEYSSQTVMLVSFPGEIMMRMLKMLILPLIISSIITGQGSVAGVAQLDATASGQMGSRALAYYFGTTICAAITGIMCVVTIHPGSPTLLKHTMEETPDILKDGSKVTTMDAFLDIIRYTDIVKEGS
ncbi:Excitatory amino acid transporter [Portunus trituberculatus]|uniref:Amino acid transporter n=1 Tax=Portunus trituberculatus TaxID=210409 RepID=A0A5B7CJY7_PORTR|nr:Excitatory amino acid transporter [Portunus trituberculatus]